LEQLRRLESYVVGYTIAVSIVAAAGVMIVSLVLSAWLIEQIAQRRK